MASTAKDDLLRRLAELNITQQTVEHPPVMTSADQMKVPELGAYAGGAVKNLFLKDKKGRLYLVSKLESTSCDLKVLARRLGLPKDSLRMAPAELMLEVLGVPLGSATPLAAGNPAAAAVVLLLDDSLKLQKQLLVHPLTNTATTIISPADLEAFLRHVGREIVYVDLAANPATSADNPPDLAQYADAAQPYAGASQSNAGAAAVSRAKPSAARPEAAKGKRKDQAAATVIRIPRGDDVDSITRSILAKVSSALLPSDAAVDSAVMRKLQSHIELELNALRNSAYARGCTATKGQLVAYLQGAN